MGLLVFLVKVVFVAATLAFGIHRLFPRVGNWLAVLVAMLLPPLFFVPSGFFVILRDIGAEGEQTGRAPPHAVDGFVGGIGSLGLQAIAWIVLACPVAIYTLRFLDRVTKPR